MTARIPSVVLLVLAFLACAALTGCGESVEGTYELDTVAYRAAAEAEIERLTTAQDNVENNTARLAANALLNVIDQMGMTMEIESGGAFSLEQRMGGGAQNMIGTWSLDDSTITITAKAEGYDVRSITGTVDGDTITLHPSDKEEMPFDMPFKRKTE